MSKRSVYLRDQAEQCRRLSRAIDDQRTQDELCKLAAEYVARAAEMESKE
jgi:hypothetical protein